MIFLEGFGRDYHDKDADKSNGLEDQTCYDVGISEIGTEQCSGLSPRGVFETGDSAASSTSSAPPGCHGGTLLPGRMERG